MCATAHNVDSLYGINILVSRAPRYIPPFLSISLECPILFPVEFAVTYTEQCPPYLIEGCQIPLDDLFKLMKYVSR